MNVTVWCRRPSKGAKALVSALVARGITAHLSRAPQQPPGSLSWGRKGGCDKLHEMRVLTDAGVAVPPHSKHPKPGWLARSFRHRSGSDLLRGGRGDYYVEKVETVREFRVHVYNGKSIRLGVKVPAKDPHHPFIRTKQGGWKLSYGGAAEYPQERAAAREIAKRAVDALSYQFGAVDVGIRPSGEAIVWEVNSAPGLEGGTIEAYADHIRGDL